MNSANRRSIELVSTGGELLDGRRLNTHAQLLGAEFSKLGFRLVRDTTVPDDADAIRDAIVDAVRRVDIVVVSGGLGPTSDDLTREVVAGIVGSRLVMHEPTRKTIVDRLSARGRKITESVQLHALVVESADVLFNSVGLAPGERIAWDGRTIFLLPGPPREFRAILDEHLLPWLKTARPDVAPPLAASFFICGPGESDIVTRLEPKGFPDAGLEVAYCARPGCVEVRLLAAPEYRVALESSASLIRRELGPHIFSETTSRMEEAVGALLRMRGATLAVAESCTGGLIGQRLTSVDGSSTYFLGGVIAYANAVKVSQLGVDAGLLKRHGAVSAETAKAMAEGARVRFGSDYGLSVTGIAGPAGGTDEKPVGLVYIAVADAHGTVTSEHRFGGNRDMIREWASQSALDLLRRRLTG